MAISRKGTRTKRNGTFIFLPQRYVMRRSEGEPPYRRLRRQIRSKKAVTEMLSGDFYVQVGEFPHFPQNRAKTVRKTLDKPFPMC